MGYYGKEVEPKGAKASDRSGEKKVGVSKVDSTKGTPSVTGAKAPAGATASDATGERKARIAGGVGMGMAGPCFAVDKPSLLGSQGGFVLTGSGGGRMVAAHDGCVSCFHGSRVRG